MDRTSQTEKLGKLLLAALSAALLAAAPLPLAAQDGSEAETFIPPPPDDDRPRNLDAVQIPEPPIPALNPDAVVSQPAETDDAEWKVSIIPAAPLTIDAGKPQAGQTTYESAYNSIPFRRGEYLANPSFRHDAAMEILFGEMRPTVIHRTDEPQRINNDPPPLYQPYLMSQGDLYSYGSWLRYAGPYLPLMTSPLVFP